MDLPMAPPVEYKGQFAKFSRLPEAAGFLILPGAGVEGTDHRAGITATSSGDHFCTVRG